MAINPSIGPHTGKSSVVNKVTMHIEGIKEISDMFKQFPPQVNKDAVWAKFWKQATTELLTAAKNEAPLLKAGKGKKSSRMGVPYPPNPKLTIARGTLKKSIELFRTKASKGDIHGAYIGPVVKGKYKKNKGGYYGAWVEYGDQVMHYGKFKSKGNKFMHRAWAAKNSSVMNKAYKLAEDIFAKTMKTHERKMKKHGILGY